MKNIAALIIILTWFSCQKENAIPVNNTGDTFDPSGATLLKQGDLMGVGHTVTGHAGVYEKDGAYVILLDPYMSQNGPDLKVYLSKDIDASEYIRLGQLKSITGKQSYQVPGTPDLNQYNYIHIWCEKFTVVFGRAEVK